MTDRIVHSEHPLNAESPLDRLAAAFITPLRDFYVRCHGDVPRPDGTEHRLVVDGRVSSSFDLTVAELRERFPERSTTAALQCAGNRRADLQAVGHTSGDPWRGGAIGNAQWTGVALADVLRAAGAEQDTGLHVAFSCRDIVGSGPSRFRYGVSIPMRKALAPEVLLAWAMDGEPLAPEHGAPLRAVVPGYAGVRSAKWLASITVQDRPSESPIQRHDYKLFPPGVTEATVDWNAGTTIEEMPLNAAICGPAEGATLPAGPVALRGYAIASGRAVARVEVSADGGATWLQAELERRPDAPWAWTLWRASLVLPSGQHELVVRAWDAAGQTQPAQPGDVWNFKGYLCACWHRVRVTAG